MRSDTLILAIYEGKIDVNSLTDEQQDQLLKDYNILAQHWAESPLSGHSDLGKQILLLIEESGIDLDETGDTLH
jgi:hypothetical protein